MDQLRYDGRVAVITGAGRGLGRSYALLLASRGAKVVVNDPGVTRHGDATEEVPANDVVEEIRAAGGEAVASLHSVATPEGGQAIIDLAVETYGSVDILIHNAGINRSCPIVEMDWEQFAKTLDVHLHGAFHVVRPALPHMYKSKFGRIVLTSSIAGLYGDKTNSAYGMAKAGLIGFSNIIALEGAEHGVQCNAIAPSAVTRLSEGIDTSAFPPMPPEQVAPMVAWLVHEKCASTGEIWVALAGRMAKARMVETRGAWQFDWTIENVAEHEAQINDWGHTATFPSFPTGFYDHLGYSFEMARNR